MENTSPDDSHVRLREILRRLRDADLDPDARIDRHDARRACAYPTRTEGPYWPGGIDLSELEDR